MPGRHLTDHQMRLYMKFRQTNRTAVAGAKASISIATAYRVEKDPKLPSQKAPPASESSTSIPGSAALTDSTERSLEPVTTTVAPSD